MLEPAVTITDFLLFVLNAAFFLALLLTRPSLLRTHFVLFFVSIGISALAGALSHGFFPETTRLGIVLWRLTMLSLGVTSAATFLIATDLLLPDRHRFFGLIAAAAVIAYALVVVFVRWSFSVAIAFYIPSAILLFIAFAVIAKRLPGPGWLGCIGMLLTFAAAYIQASRIGLHPKWFDHNATYHLVQAVGLLLIFLAARNLLSGVSNILGKPLQ